MQILCVLLSNDLDCITFRFTCMPTLFYGAHFAFDGQPLVGFECQVPVSEAAATGMPRFPIAHHLFFSPLEGVVDSALFKLEVEPQVIIPMARVKNTVPDKRIIFLTRAPLAGWKDPKKGK